MLLHALAICYHVFLIIYYYTDTLQLVFQSVLRGHWGSFQSLAIVNTVAMNGSVKVFMWIHFPFSWATVCG